MISFQISELPPEDFWSSLISLQVLYLDGNLLSEQSNTKRLNGCRKLHILTLYNTPLSLIHNYRHHTINRSVVGKLAPPPHN